MTYESPSLTPNAVPAQKNTNPNGGATAVHALGPATPLHLDLMIVNAPKLNEPVTVVMTLTSIDNASNTTADLDLGDKAVLVSGDTTFQGDVTPSQPVQFQAVIKFVKPGNATLRAVALAKISADQVWGDSVELYLTIGQDASHFGFDDKTAPQQQGSPPPPPPAITAAPMN